MFDLKEHPKKLTESSALEVELATILQTLVFLDEPSRVSELTATRRPAPLYLEQARMLARDYQLRGRLRIILDSNEFPIIG